MQKCDVEKLHDQISLGLKIYNS